MTTFVEGLTAAQCWTCGDFYRLFFWEAIDLDTGEPVAPRRAPLGNPAIADRARTMAFERLSITFMESDVYEAATKNGAAMKPSREVVQRLIARGQGEVTAPVHVMVPNKASRLNTADVDCSVRTMPLSAGFFVRGFEQDVLIAGPELCVLQLAMDLSVQKLAQLVTELCSTYYFVKEPQPALVGESGELRSVPVKAERAKSNRAVPVSSLEAMEGFAARFGSSVSGRRMARAVRYALEGSASPMETAVGLMLSLSKALGGYGLPSPKMNWAIEMLGDDGAKYVRVLDMYWPECGVGLEYDSSAFHSGDAKMRADSLRRNEVGAQDVRLFTATADHVSSLEKMDKLASQLSRALGRGSLRSDRLAPVEERRQLLASLRRRSIAGLA